MELAARTARELVLDGTVSDPARVAQVIPEPGRYLALVGSIDLVYREPGRGWTVLDWKTNRPPSPSREPLDL